MAVVRDEDHAALVVLHGEGQRFAHFEVEVVGRLVEQQQVGSGADEQGQGQAGFLAAGEGLDGASRHVAAKIEAADVIAQFLLRRRRFEPDEVLQRRLVRAQLFELVLGEVADAERLGFLALAALLGDGTGQQLDQRRFAGAIAAEQANAAARAQGHGNVVEDLALSVPGRGFFDGQQRVGQGGRLAEAEMEGRIDVGRGDRFHALQHLDPALCLARLGGLGAEALDEAVEVGDLALLRFVRRLLVGQPGGPGALVVRIAAAGQR